jgi:uncharacterized Zn finger protein (UPF0148 family)
MKTCSSCQMPSFTAKYRLEMGEVLCGHCYRNEIMQKEIDDADGVSSDNYINQQLNDRSAVE